MTDWTAPATFTPGQIVTATDLNTNVRDNPLYLFTRPQQTILSNVGTDYTTTSTTFVDIDATNLKITKTLFGTAVLLGFTGSYALNNTATVYWDFDINGTRFASGGTEGITGTPFSSTLGNLITLVVLVTGLTPGSNTFKIKWRVSANTATLFSGVAASGKDFLPDFWCIEVG